MKKMIALLLSACMLGACCITGCTDKTPDDSGDSGIVNPGDGGDVNPGDGDGGNDQDKNDPEIAGDEIQTDRASLDFCFEGLYKQGELKDAAAGFEKASDVSGGRFFVNGQYYNKISEVTSRQDVKLELYNGSHSRMVNLSAGMAFTLPATSVEVDYTIAKYRTQYTFDDSVLTFSAENRNPYTALANAWYVFVNEWAIRHLINPKYYENNGLTLLNELSFPVELDGDGERAYPVAPHGDLTFRDGYEVYRFDIQINDENDIVERPFYNIGIIHEVNDPKNCAFFVMKSKANKSETMDAILKSWNRFTAKGVQRNYFGNHDPVEDPHWSEETLKFFRQFSTQKTKSWGVFSYSMPGGAAELNPGDYNYDLVLGWSKDIQQFIEETAWGGKKYDVYMTYTHLGTGAADNPNRTPHYFPTSMAKELASGNGYNDKPVLEFTYQYTTNNNLVDEEVTPMFDIMRGKFDELFKRLALDIKEYGKPVMFRLNNEMNTDWTSYSGIMNLLDPDIFTMTWIKLYNIFIENGVDNVIWVWNPIADSCPYSGWGEDLCYFPGLDYVQLLGGTNYEANNYSGNAEKQYTTFRDRYNSLYEKNKPYFEKWSMILGEFACGSGGDASGALGRNREAQAKWVEGMFEDLNAEKPMPYAQQIKGLIWFNCNDYSGSQITNRYKFADLPEGTGYHSKEKYDDLECTWEAFRKGFEDAKKIK